MLPKEKIFLKIAVICSLFGLLLLIIISNYLPRKSVESTTIGSIEETPEGTEISVKGTITSIKNTPTILIITIEDAASKVNVIADKKYLQENLKEKSIIEVTGTIKIFNNEKEIQASSVTILS